MDPCLLLAILAYQFKLTISRQVGDDTWDLTQLLCLIREELKARENRFTLDNSFTRNLQDSYKVGEKLFLILHIHLQVYMFLNKLRK